jgi:hypothetical protein
MLFVILAWCVQILLLSGIGWLVYARLCHLNSATGWCARDFFRSFWIGWGVLLAVAQFVTLFFPLKGLCLLLAGSVALPGLWWQARAVRARVATAAAAPRWKHYVFWILLALCALRLAAGLGMLGWSGAYDSDLYHFNSVRWAKEYPAVPGLANLFSPLGVNSTYLLYAAIMDHGCYYREAAWIVPGVFVVMFVAQLLWTWLLETAANQRTRLCASLLLAYALLQVCDTVPSLYYDRPAAICLCLAVLELLHLEPASAPPRETLAGLFALLLLAAVSVSIKPVGLVATALLGALGFVLAWRLPQRAAWLRVLVLPAALAAGMLARNAILSGWLLYPAPHGQLPVSWAVPERTASVEPGAVMHTVRNGYAMFRAWARQPGPGYLEALRGGPWQWLRPWWQKNHHAVELKLLGGGLLFLVLGLLPGRRRAPAGLLHFAVLLTGANLAFWFFTAPDLRFGEGYFWLWFALTGTLLLLRFGSPRHALERAGTLALIALLPAQPGWAWPENIGWWQIGHALEANYHTVQIHNGQQPPLYVLVPDGDDRAGDIPLPNTPYPQDALCCRVPGDLRQGFYVKPVAVTPAAN